MRTPAILALLAAAWFCPTPYCHAELSMSAVFGDQMVLQRNQPIRVWGWAEAGAEVSVTLAGKSAAATAGEDGRFETSLPAMSAGGPHELTVTSKDDQVSFSDVLVGEVWVCSGQSNMEWPIAAADDADLESLSANYPQMRIITVPHDAAGEPQKTFNGSWQAVTPESVKQFSAVGYLFGRQLHQILGVPVGLIDNAWGGSAAEAWVDRETLEESGQYDELLAKWETVPADFNYRAEMTKYEAALAKWRAGGKDGDKPPQPEYSRGVNHRPGFLYNGCVHPIFGYSVAGVIWYQGESNAGRSYQYRELFPLMIETWRRDWRQEKLPFYWVQLADFLAEQDEPGESGWAELREAQTMTMDRLPNTGQAVIIDLGEAQDIHPRDKQNVAKRLARWALANVYDFDVVYQSPRFREMTVQGDVAVLKFDHVGAGLRAFDIGKPVGFAIAGEDRTFVYADAKIVDSDTIEVTAEGVDTPVAVRYGWADNPIVNVESREGLPLTPFRTDDWPGVTINNVK